MHKIVYEHFDPNMKPKDLDGPASHQTGDFKSAWAIHEEQEEAAHKAMMEAHSRPYKPVPDALIDDWTGTHFVKNWKTYGQPSEDPPVAEKLNDRGFSTGEPFHKPRSEAKENDAPAKESFLMYDPFDRHLADVDSIMQRYKQQDAA